MQDRLTVLRAQLEIHLNAAMATIMEMREEASKLGTGQPASNITSDVLTDHQIAEVLAKRERTIQRNIERKQNNKNSQ